MKIVKKKTETFNHHTNSIFKLKIHSFKLVFQVLIHVFKNWMALKYLF